MGSKVWTRVSPGLVIALIVVAAVGYGLFVGGQKESDMLAETDAMYEKVKLAFFAGQWQEAHRLLDQWGDRSFRKYQAREIQAMVDRVDRAVGKANEAGFIVDRDPTRAAQLMAEAVHDYPESRELARVADYFAANVAFQRKDYDLYLKLAEKNAGRAPENAAMQVWFANALATKYAVGGDKRYSDQAEATLARAQTLSWASPESEQIFKDLEERIRHRLKTREIVSPEEFDRRFRVVAGAQARKE